MKKFITVTLAILGLSVALSSQAAVEGFNQAPKGTAPGGFENNAPTTVAGIKKNGYDDQVVYLRGKLVKYLGGEMYEFADVNGDIIKVELDNDKYWGNINKDQLIDIVGELDKDFLGMKLDVKSAQPVAATN